MHNFFRKLAVLLLFAIASHYAKANFSYVKELYYRHVSGSTYEFTAIVYRNCLVINVAPTPSLTLSASSESQGFNYPNIAWLSSTNTINITNPGPPPPNLINCATGPACYEEFIYRGTYTVPFKASDWLFTVGHYWTDSTYDNIVSTEASAACGLNNIDFPDGSNDSPFWHNPDPKWPNHLMDTVINYPVKSVCEGKQVTIDQSVIEYQSDSIAYSLYADGGEFISPYDSLVPFPLNSPSTLAISGSGSIDLNAGPPIVPNVTNRYWISVRADEYRLDTSLNPPSMVHIGFVQRTLTLHVEPQASCPASNLDFSDSLQLVACSDSSFVVSTSENFICSSADSNGSFISLVDSATGIPEQIQSVTMDYCWNGTISDDFRVNLGRTLPPGTYYLTVKTGGDGNSILSECEGEFVPLSDTVILKVNPVDAFQLPLNLVNTKTNGAVECGQSELALRFIQQYVCSSVDTSGSEFLLVNLSTSDTVEIMSVRKGLCLEDVSDSLRLLLSKPLDPGLHRLSLQLGVDSNTVLNECRIPAEIDSLDFIVDDIQVDLGPDLIYCDDTVYSAVLDAGPEFSKYAWSNGITARRIQVSAPGFYSVRVENQFGCVDRDTIEIREVDCDTAITTGITNIDALFEWYPNPVNDKLFIRSNRDVDDLELVIRTAGGKVILQHYLSVNAKQNREIDLSDFAPGIYFIEWRTNSTQLQFDKLIVQ